MDEHDQLRKTYDELWEKKEAERNSVALIDKTLRQKQNERVQLEKTSAAEIKLLKLKIEHKRAELKKCDEEIVVKTEQCESQFSNMSS